MAKGSQFEREVCKKLSCWWTGTDDDLVFWRSSNSGGRMTVRHRKGKKTKGGGASDLVAIKPEGKPFTDVFAVEVKRGYSKNTIADLFDRTNQKCVWIEWYKQVRAAQEREGAHTWMIIARRDKRKALVVMERDVWFSTGNGEPSGDIWFTFEATIGDEHVNAIGMPLESFLLWFNKYETLRLKERFERNRNVPAGLDC